MHFGDKKSAVKILSEQNPVRQKKLGKKINGCSDEKWQHFCDDIMLKGLLEKFEQNNDLRAKLLETYPRKLFESTEFDTYWGTGLPLSSKHCLNSSKHCGKNKMGELLHFVRNKYVEEWRGIGQGSEMEVKESDVT